MRLSVALLALLAFSMVAVGCTQSFPLVQPQRATAAASAPADGNVTHHQTELPLAQTAATPAQPPILDPSRGNEIGAIYEAFLTPQQEPGEEEDTPALTPKAFVSTAPSVPRNQRTSRGHGMLRFTKDLSRVYVDVQVENIVPSDVVMFHIHCGRPDMLGPILVDFGLMGDLQENLADGLFSVVVTNEHIEMTEAAGHGLVGFLTAGCPIGAGLPDKVATIAGMEYIARHSELYFNLHTAGQTFFGEMRGQIHPVQK